MGGQRERGERGPVDSDSYITPAWIWQPWHKHFNLVLDAAASDQNHLPCVDKWYTKETNAFDQDWAADSTGGSVWCNPPYGKAAGPIEAWMRKGLSAWRRGATVVMLLPADTSTRWYHTLVPQCTYSEFVLGRIRFVGASGPAKFGSLIVVMGSPPP